MPASPFTAGTGDSEIYPALLAASTDPASLKLLPDPKAPGKAPAEPGTEPAEMTPDGRAPQKAAEATGRPQETRQPRPSAKIPRRRTCTRRRSGSWAPWK
ncbi:hypothetical protein SAV31267_097850 [Streptomyces avermitilis]|uniref:Uncharacterized protein n=1 Tax=Streptomyces avermitilis TaxID=33903 RepID=A0A4D4N7A5_STRAX|nr:hypothetical protein SAV31267_097850 [Streptomyces avermitilis]